MAVEAGRDLLAHTARIISAYLSRHPCEAEELPGLILLVRDALRSVSVSEEAPPKTEVSASRPEPAVPIKRSVFPDHIICLEDGKKLKTLKRHLASAYGLTPAAYRARWGLPASYPMVAPDYASARSKLAREIGLGRRQRPDPE